MNPFATVGNTVVSILIATLTCISHLYSFTKSRLGDFIHNSWVRDNGYNGPLDVRHLNYTRPLNGDWDAFFKAVEQDEVEHFDQLTGFGR